MLIFFITFFSVSILNFLVSYIIVKNKIISYDQQINILTMQLENRTKDVDNMMQEQNIMQKKIDNEIERRSQAEQNALILKEKLYQSEEKFQNWELLKTNSIENAKAAIFEIGNKLTSKLIDDHQKETESSRIKQSQTIQENEKKFTSQMELIIQSVGVLRKQIDDSKQTVDLVKNALLSPSGAGSLAEITLENILKNSGLIKNTDYIIQYSYSDNKDKLYRPDAVVFLPGDNVMVIDSKASKFFLELEIQNNFADEKFKQSMKTHIKNLSTKSYKDSIKEFLSSEGRDINHISMIMFLPSESVIEKLMIIDPSFLTKAWELNVFPTGPAGLVNILSHAKFQVNQTKQVENYNLIVEEVSQLLNNIATLHEHAKKVGNSIQNAAISFDKFAGSFNSRIVSKSKKMIALGIQENKKLSELNNLSRMQIITSDKMRFIESENISQETELLQEEIKEEEN
jgi:DNA recombination protein RmuC